MVAIITGVFSLIGIIITCSVTNKKTRSNISKEFSDLKQEFKVTQAVTDTKIEELTREVREHNNFARRMPLVENEIKHIKSDINKYHK